MRKLAIAVLTVAATLTLPSYYVHAATEADQKIPVPTDFREWIYLTTGLDMSYATASSPHTGPSIFDNVFVNPEAWRTFKQTGTWPDGTTFVLENRVAEQNVSINRTGRTQGSSVDGIELHQKRDGEWAFYSLGNDGAEHLIARPAACYTCHESHAAVDTTFAQFYPTALPIAKQKSTISKAYLSEISAPPAK